MYECTVSLEMCNAQAKIANLKNHLVVKKWRLKQDWPHRGTYKWQQTFNRTKQLSCPHWDPLALFCHFLSAFSTSALLNFDYLTRAMLTRTHRWTSALHFQLKVVFIEAGNLVFWSSPTPAALSTRAAFITADRETCQSGAEIWILPDWRFALEQCSVAWN